MRFSRRRLQCTLTGRMYIKQTCTSVNWNSYQSHTLRLHSEFQKFSSYKTKMIKHWRFIFRRTAYLQNAFSAAGLYTGNTTIATYAHVTPPRATGMETIIVSANWLSRDGSENLRGIAMLLALGDFLRGRSVQVLTHKKWFKLITSGGVQGQNHWAFDFVLVVGEECQSGLAEFMTQYHSLFSGVIWTGLNIDYPGHSFSHLGVFYGKSPSQPFPCKIYKETDI